MLKTKLIAASCVTLALLASQGAWASNAANKVYTFTANAPAQTASCSNEKECSKKAYLCVQATTGANVWILSTASNTTVNAGGNPIYKLPASVAFNTATGNAAPATAPAFCSLGDSGSPIYANGKTTNLMLSSTLFTLQPGNWSTGVLTNG